MFKVGVALFALGVVIISIAAILLLGIAKFLIYGNLCRRPFQRCYAEFRSLCSHESPGRGVDD